ncbi:thermonuclease family protein [Sphingobium bisphenolivorans]|uniref:thermonuclease family protein n=1 Tax=Sphingobium bisphenolivorans TaxID=1335760 RepID=UPI0003B66141|nr:thermonuclease family protein [Sphingobium bisphenolivorans]
MVRFAACSLALLSLSSPATASGFALCHGAIRGDCVVDGDTFWFGGQKIRVADIDTPETHGPRCEAEAELGARATERLRALLSEGGFALEPVGQERDRYGRTLRVVKREGRSIGSALIKEGLARPWTGSRQPWCRS